MSSEWPFSFDTSNPTDRLKQLVNNEYLSDVTFKVGSAGKLIYAHKNIITSASQVFFEQLNADDNGNNNNLVVIEDIEPETFLMVMNYIYCSEIALTSENMVDIYYVALKYQVQELRNRCLVFCESAIDMSNALFILDQNHRHKFVIIDDTCLHHIQRNPLMFFNQPDFLNLNRRTVEVIAESRSINCQKEHLQEAIDNWNEANGSNQILIFPEIDRPLCRKLKSYSKICYCKNISTELHLTVENPFRLYGLGIFAGQKTPIGGVMTVNISVEGVNKVSITKKIPFKNDLYTYKILFQQVLVMNTGTIKIKVTPPRNNPGLFCLDAFGCANNSTNLDVQVEARSYLPGGPTYNCIAYLLYNQ